MCYIIRVTHYIRSYLCYKGRDLCFERCVLYYHYYYCTVSLLCVFILLPNSRYHRDSFVAGSNMGSSTSLLGSNSPVNGSSGNGLSNGTRAARPNNLPTEHRRQHRHNSLLTGNITMGHVAKKLRWAMMFWNNGIHYQKIMYEVQYYEEVANALKNVDTNSHNCTLYSFTVKR